MVGFLVNLTVIVTLVSSAIDILDIELLSDASHGFLFGYYNVLLALLILSLGLAASKFVYTKLAQSNELLAKVVRISIIVLTSVVALERTQLAAGLTSLPYEMAIYALAFAFGVGGAIALGLGGKEFVARWLQKRG